jgi:hypothetical protein
MRVLFKKTRRAHQSDELGCKSAPFDPSVMLIQAGVVLGMLSSGHARDLLTKRAGS